MEDPAIYLIVAVFVILAAWIPLFLGRLPLSLPMIAVGGGLLLGVIVHSGDPFGPPADLMRTLSEFALLVSVLGAGLKIDRRFSLRGWLSTWRLLIAVMPLSIAAIAIAAHAFIGASWGVAIIFGAALAPTDPVLASDYSSGPPGVGEEGETKFALTSEAGLNDGLAYPFVALGLMLASGADAAAPDFARWVLIDLLWNIVGAIIVGVVLGFVMARVNAMLPRERRLSASNSGIVAVGLAFLAFALAFYAHTNGFIAVFCEAVAIRNFSSGFDYSRQLDHAAGQFERVAMVLVLALLGVSLTRGLFTDIGWLDAAFAAVALIVVRPVAVGIAFVGARDDRWTRAALGYFGLRGIASLYYAAYVAPQLSGAAARQLNTIIGLVIVTSVVFYGMTAHAVASRLTGGEDEFEG
jgi:NhaP-type Na+/H+ or K+/H+ antiporter